MKRASATETIKNRSKHAVRRFLKSMNCAQAILETYAPAMGLSIETSRRIASAFAGGMGMGSECGAVTGAFLVIGLKYGKTLDNDPKADQETFKRVTEFVKEFKARNNYIGCSQLLGIDMSTPEGVQEAGKKGLFTKRCPTFILSATEILERIIA